MAGGVMPAGHFLVSAAAKNQNVRGFRNRRRISVCFKYRDCDRVISNEPIG